MNTKIIFFDIDGTILSHRTFQISDSTKAAIKQAKDNGHLTFINTGRTIAEIDHTITDVGFDGFVCGCGTSISYHGNILLQTTLPTDTTLQLIKDLRELNIEAVLEGSKAIYFDHNSNSPLINELRNSQFIHNFNLLSWDSPDISIDKFCMWPNTEEGSARFYEKYKDTFDFIDRDRRLYEVVPKNYSKASGIEFLLSHLNIPHENTFALGDGPNDLPMLEYAKHSIAMENAPDDIKRIVSYVTKDVDHDGVAHALKHFNII